MISEFHFLHPIWLLSLLPLAALLWLLYRKKAGNSTWSKVIDANLLPLLLKGSETKTSRISYVLLAIAWLVSVIALADPVWEKIPRPVFQTNAARVIVLDLSRSMLIPDLKPSRLARARFKIEDILSRNAEGQIGLVVFAGDGFTAAPLTRDTDTISSLLQVLKPDIMPAQGSRADLGLLKAQELLKQAGMTNGQVLLIADGVVGNKAEEAAKKLKKDGYIVSVLAVGTEAGGQIPQLSQAITVKLESKKLRDVAKSGGGVYQLISNSNNDLAQLLNPLTPTSADSSDNQAGSKATSTDDLQSQDWKSNAPYLILLLLPLAAYAFRKGWLFNIVVVIGITSLSLQPQPAMAFSFDDTINNAWTNLWQRKDQQANKALEQQQYQQASELAKDPFLKGSAEYKQGDFQQALENFTKSTGADADYNRGNTLAKLEKYEDALKAYNKTLKQDVKHEDAKVNKEAVEKLLKEQQNKSDKQQKNKEGNKQSGDNKQDQKDESAKDKQQGDKQDQQNKNADEKEGENKDNKNGQQGENNQFSDAAKKLDEKNKQPDNEQNEADQNNREQAQNEQDKGNQDGSKKSAQKNEENKDGSKKPQQENDDSQNNTSLAGTNAEANELTKEEKIAAEQWLRRIPDDPGGLLRRKFTRQYRQRHPQRRGPANNTNFW